MNSADDTSAVTMYTTTSCPSCRRAEQFLATKGVTAIERVYVDDQPGRRPRCSRDLDGAASHSSLSATGTLVDMMIP